MKTALSIETTLCLAIAEEQKRLGVADSSRGESELWSWEASCLPFAKEGKPKPPDAQTNLKVTQQLGPDSILWLQRTFIFDFT